MKDTGQIKAFPLLPVRESSAAHQYKNHRQAGTYETRAVAFLDLLGFRDLIRSGKERGILTALDIVPAFDQEFREMLHDMDIQITAFSDSVVCSGRILAKKNYLPAAYIALYAGRIALEMLSMGILVRGGLTVGKLYHQGSIVFGPALIEAYELESQHARFPRILAGPKTWGQVNLCLMVYFTEWFLDTWPRRKDSYRRYSDVPGPFRIDFDGLCHVDILGPFFINERPRSLRLKKNVGIQALGPATKRVINRVCKEKTSDISILTKREWLRSYFEDCCRRFGWKA